MPVALRKQVDQNHVNKQSTLQELTDATSELLFSILSLSCSSNSLFSSFESCLDTFFKSSLSDTFLLALLSLIKHFIGVWMDQEGLFYWEIVMPICMNK